MSQVTIIGAGWSGLAAAVELARYNIPVTVYESAKQIGGRARDVEINGVTLDNGQHLMIGAYIQLLSLLRQIGINEADVFRRIPQQIRLLDMQSGKIAFDLKLPSWPAPLNLLGGMLQTPSLSFTDKIKTLWRFNKLLNQPLTQDISVSEWLKAANLPRAYSDYLLKPLCLAALTTHPEIASARAFQSVLQQTFNGPRENTDLLIARTTLGKIFPDAAKNFITSRGGNILTGHKVSSIDIKEQILAVNDEPVSYRQLIIATPPQATIELLRPHTSLDEITNKLAQLKHDPVCTVYLQYPQHTGLPLPMLGCIHATSEWLFDRAYCNQPGLISVVISADGPHMSLSNDELINKIRSELAELFPDWPMPLTSQVIREKRAGFRCHIDVDKHRPGIRTAINSIKLCGDYVYIEDNLQPGLPATLEGAVRSGVKCAQLILQDRHSCNT
jgi:squalene-associated FAD-dependent desaturase